MLVAAAVGADRLAAFGAARLVAAQVRTSAGLASTPGVDFAGFPFLTQVASGDYGHVVVTARQVASGPVRLAWIRADLFGVRFPPSHLVGGHLGSVPVSAGTGSVLIGYADLAAGAPAGARGLRFSPDGPYVRLSGAVRAGKATVDVDVDATVTARGRVITFTPVDGTVRVGASTVPRGPVSVDLGALPFGVQLTSAAVRPDGVRFSARSTGFVIGAS